MVQTVGGDGVPHGEILVPEEVGDAPGNYAVVAHPHVGVAQDETEDASSHRLGTVADSAPPFPVCPAFGGSLEESHPHYDAVDVGVENLAPGVDQSVPVSGVCSLG